MEIIYTDLLPEGIALELDGKIYAGKKKQLKCKSCLIVSSYSAPVESYSTIM